MLSDKDIEMISEVAKKYLDGDSPTFKFISKQQEEFFKRRSGEMANTLPLKGNEETPLAGSSPASGISELMRAHECLLNTLAPSKNPWVKEVHKNAKAYYQTWLKKHIMT